VNDRLVPRWSVLCEVVKRSPGAVGGFRGLNRKLASYSIATRCRFWLLAPIGSLPDRFSLYGVNGRQEWLLSDSEVGDR
jgi:hypothetical protein